MACTNFAGTLASKHRCTVSDRKCTKLLKAIHNHARTSFCTFLTVSDRKCTKLLLKLTACPNLTHHSLPSFRPCGALGKPASSRSYRAFAPAGLLGNEGRLSLRFPSRQGPKLGRMTDTRHCPSPFRGAKGVPPNAAAFRGMVQQMRCPEGKKRDTETPAVSGRLLFQRHPVKHYEAVVLKWFITLRLLYAANVLNFCIKLAALQQIPEEYLFVALLQESCINDGSPPSKFFRKTSPSFNEA